MGTLVQGREEHVGCHGMTPLWSRCISVAPGSTKGTVVMDPLSACHRALQKPNSWAVEEEKVLAR